MNGRMEERVSSRDNKGASEFFGFVANYQIRERHKRQTDWLSPLLLFVKIEWSIGPGGERALMNGGE